jgi:hypothetical protein
MREVRNAYTVLGGKPEGDRPLGRPRRRWKNNIKVYRKEIEFWFVDWVFVSG